ncbi:MAG: VWA domain-containing protein [Deltaproteobacteria bacterium]|nr:VWA domain-containing protein [Deltaproteobacteria bacterium]
MADTIKIIPFVIFLSLLLATACGDDVNNDNGEGTDSNGDSISGSTDSSGGDSDSFTPGDTATFGDTATHSGSATDSESEETCGSADVDFTSQIPTVVLLIDRSGSMDQPFPQQGDPQRWDVVKEALINPDSGLVKQLQSDVRFGLSLYSSEGGGIVPDECPILINVDPALDNYSAIFTPYDDAGLSIDTPTTESIQAVAATLATVTDPGPKVIVLATDGDPDTCADADDHSAATQAKAEAAVADAYATHGITTFVISVGGDTTPSHMQRMANAGQGVADGEPDAPWWEATDAQGLADAFDTIINGVRSCVMDLDGEMVAGKEGDCAVAYESAGQTTALTMGDANGWRVNSATQIELLGTACEAIKSGEVTASVKCPCDAVISVE